MRLGVPAALAAFILVVASGPLAVGFESHDADRGPSDSAQITGATPSTALPHHPHLGDVRPPLHDGETPSWTASPPQASARLVEQALASTGWEDWTPLAELEARAIPAAIADIQGLSLPEDRCSDTDSPSLETAVGDLALALNRSGGLAEDLEMAPAARQALAPLVACIALHVEQMPEIEPHALVQDEETRAAWLSIQRDLLHQLDELEGLQLSHDVQCVDAGCLVQVGGPANNTYTQPAMLTVDEGGNDTYRNNAGGASQLSQERPIALTLDRGEGNDRYEPEETDTYHHPTLGAGFDGGVGILVDEGGDDRFEAVGTTMGAGFSGAGLLLSKGGDDVYFSPYPDGGGILLGESQKVSIAASVFGGYGVLIDRAGNDSYTQQGVDSIGWGGAGGLGLLVDNQGNDAYVDEAAPTGEIGGNASDPDAVSGVSIATGEVGGAGVVLDSVGDDVYRCETPLYYGCAGSSTAGVIGLLHDALGHDTYALGAEYEDAPGFSGGLGAGDLGGVGLLVDDGGQDAYASQMPRTGGYGELGLGLFVDRADSDTYDFLVPPIFGERADDSVWIGQQSGGGTLTGYGLDGGG